jgi:hypothetical protein
MIFWGKTPAGSQAQLYLPALNAKDILQIADSRYFTHKLTQVDAHTIAFNTGGVTFVPLPSASSAAAGLLAIDLPTGIQKGDIYNVAVRQVTDATPPQVIEISGRPQQDRAEIYKPASWRRVSGAFQFTITISTKSKLLLSEERLLAVMRWIWEHMPHQKRWYPVLQRYISDIAGRVQGFGGDPSQIPPSETGQVPELTKKPHHHDCIETTGKIRGIIFDHFGDFEGFTVEDKCGLLHRFTSHERPMLAVVQRAWEERIKVTVLSESRHEALVHSVILLAGSRDAH